MDSPFWCVDTIFYTTTYEKMNTLFQYYLFQKINWLKYNEASGVPSLSASSILNIMEFIPNIDEQSKISNFLSVIDKRIQTQNKIIRDLNALLKAIKDSLVINTSSSWKNVKLKEILDERKKYSVKCDKYPHVTLSKEGIGLKSDRYDRDFLVKSSDKKYKICIQNDICYNPANLKFGVICLNTFGIGIFSPIYVTFEVDRNYDPFFISCILTNENFIGHARRFEQGTVYERMAVSPEDFLKLSIKVPDLLIQREISNKIRLLEKKIKIEKDILSDYNKQKEYLLNGLFI